jgi:hypothetical protein
MAPLERLGQPQDISGAVSFLDGVDEPIRRRTEGDAKITSGVGIDFRAQNPDDRSRAHRAWTSSMGPYLRQRTPHMHSLLLAAKN